MNINDIRARLANGFEPFVLRLTDGRTVPVPHPDFIAIGRRAIVVLDAHDVSRKIDVLHVVSIDDMPQGKKRR